jgi:hypothetical protein
MSEIENDDQKRTSRRDALKMSGVVAAAAAAMIAGGAAPAGAASGTAGSTWTAAELATFSGLMTKMWASPTLLKQYNTNPTKFLAAHGLTLAAGTPAPVIPKKPTGTWGKTSPAAHNFLKAEMANWAVSYDNKVTNVGLADSAGCFSSASCPVCTFACFGTCSKSTA